MSSTVRLLIFLILYKEATCQTLLSKGKTIIASTVHESTTDKWKPRNAVDGNPSRLPDDCNCCAATQQKTNQSFELDLGRKALIERIVVEGRGEEQKYGHHLQNMEVYLASKLDGGTPITNVTDQVYILNYTLPQPTVSRYVTLLLNSNTKRYFVICELSVYGECLPGYRPPSCNECPNGTYGQNCSHTCGKCLNNAPCNKTNGVCERCASGYQGTLCKSTCEARRHGLNCTKKCGHCKHGHACNVTNGVCPNGCDAGYKEHMCKTECEAGTHGYDCLNTCGTCLDSQPCNIFTGSCTNGCDPGYHTDLCNTTCDPGNYGRDCKSVCGGCINGTACDIFNGSCTMCDPGYTGDTCLSPSGLGNGPGGIAGSGRLVYIILAAVVLALIAIGIVIFVRVKRRKSRVPRGASYAVRATNDVDTIRPLSKLEERMSFKSTKAHVGHNTKPPGSKTNTTAEVQRIGDDEGADGCTTEDDDDHQYYGFVVKETDLKVHQLWDYINEKKKENNLLFHREFAQLPAGMQHPHTIASLPENKPKNRYKGLSAYDHTRVPLEAEEGESDYINACFINGYGQIKKFIASQGPTKEMQTDFWRMVWQQKSNQIVMVTNLVEMGTVKCLLYWPTEGSVTFGNIKITLITEDVSSDYDIRKLDVQNVKQSRPSVTVTHYHYKAWPDKDVPDSTWSLVKFWRIVADDREKIQNSGPIVVHCSAGIGRTGTFIALDHAYNQVKLEGSLRFQSIVRSLREQRVNMVQTCNQYVYVHEAVADALLFGTHNMWSNQFADVYQFLKQSEPGTNKTRMRIQYDIIVESVKNDTKATTELKVRKDETNEHTVGKASLSAVLLPNTMGKDTFIAAKTPDKNNTFDLWSLINERNITTIVTLMDAGVTDQQNCCFHDDEKIISGFSVRLVEEVSRDVNVERTMTYKPTIGENVTVKQFVCAKWSSGNTELPQPRSMIEFLESVLVWQEDLSDKQPILVHCSSGSEKSGLVCVLLNELKRMKKDGGHINIISSVKTVKARNTDIIPTYEQYQYIYDVIRCYLEGGDVYANL